MPFLSLFQSITAQRTFLNLILARALCASSLSALIVVGKSYSAGSTSKTGALESSSPNILLVVADDLGYSDLGAFGGEIDTPNLDALATSGIRFTNFYAAPNCSPSRSMLLTGQDNHRVGMGAMAEALQGLHFLQGKPGYEGHLKPDIPTIADVLSNAGYRTYMTGK